MIKIKLPKLLFKKKKEKKHQESNWTETLKTLIYAFVFATIIRSFCYEPFHIPSGSMKPGLIVGDYIFVSKYSYGYSRYSLPLGLPIIKNRIFKKDPKRGDVIVFRYPAQPSINYIKRLIGLPGDRVQMKDGVLYINEKEVPKKYIDQFKENELNGILTSSINRFEETLSNGKKYKVLDKIVNSEKDNTQVYIVPENYYFFLGDNRDASLDSRFASTGVVHLRNLVGKARVIFLSASENPLKFWKWHKSIKLKRFWKKIE